MKLALVVLLFSLPLVAKDKQPNLEWKTGTLVNQQVDKHCGSNSSECTTTTVYEIDTGGIVYTLAMGVRWSWQSDLFPVTVNAPIRYIVDGDHVVVLDEKGHAHKMSVVRKSIKHGN